MNVVLFKYLFSIRKSLKIFRLTWEMLEQLFLCNVVEADKKVPMLLTLIGGEAYNVLKDQLTQSCQVVKLLKN